MSGMNLTVYSIDGVVPVVDPTAFVHPSAVLIGDVIVGAGCYVGPAACLRGDFGHIEIRAGANVQDTCVLHGCRVERNGLVGMNAVVNDNAVVGDSAIVAAMAFVKAGMVIPPRTIAAGVPAKVLRGLTDTELAWKVEGTRHYQDLARRSRETMRAVAPLAAPEPGRARLELPEMLPLSVVKERVGR